MELGHFNKHFVKNTRKKASQGHVFLPDTLEAMFWMEQLTQIETQSGPSFQKSEHFSSDF